MSWGQAQEHSPCWALSPGLGTRPGHQRSLMGGEGLGGDAPPIVLLSSLGHPGREPWGVWPASIPPAA